MSLIVLKGCSILAKCTPRPIQRERVRQRAASSVLLFQPNILSSNPSSLSGFAIFVISVTCITLLRLWYCVDSNVYMCRNGSESVSVVIKRVNVCE